MIADIFPWIRQRLERLDRALRKWEAVEVEIDAIRCEMEALLGLHDQAPRRERPSVGPNASATILEVVEWEKAQTAYAAAGAAELKVSELSNGDYEFRIDGHRLKLPPRLAALLQVLARPDSTSGTSPGALVPWKSRLQVRIALATELGHPISDHALNGLVFRLRQEIQLQIKFHRNFVMVHPVHGLRFAVQQKARGDGSARDPL
jgi:hypothetical protein